MGMWGGGGGMMGGGAAGWSQNIAGGGGHMGPTGPGRRGADGWDDEELGKALDTEVIRRLMPYLKEYKFLALTSLVTMLLTAIAQYTTPLVSGLVVAAAIRGDQHMVTIYAIIM